MIVNTQAVNFNANPELLNFVKTRMDKLETYYDKVIKSDVFLKIENTSGKENKIFEAKVSIPGDSLIIKKQCKSFEEGADTAIASLQRQLKKRKEKLRAHL
ncbi:putative sigma-54 modulation protein [Lacinutrix venerupis]|uniref:Ribosomal subunit interface protein n=1 Tax=Lacinutrix venerupis TaxID=1486034 RepID=A0AAC9LLH8_9FLAO|nr:ribosome-associated translation inhibitor RaiA [Lacinutrix venerupis]APY00901.1 ribosomal subunit interface protein [Lacinutrix venerupis]RLJ67097.1 putative sigma-54 modulation protein [Lacinutrix venerupis]